MYTLSDPHQMFAECFPEKELWPFAWLLSKGLEEGHICVSLNEYEAMASALPYPPGSIEGLRSLDRVVGRPGEARPFILDGDRLYLQRYHVYETRIVARIAEKIASGKYRLQERMSQLEGCRGLIASLQADFSLEGLQEDECVDWQLVAAINALMGDFGIITGGPGTGKTTTLAKILQILYTVQPDVRIALAAPTGKAAMRMLESLKRSAQRFSPALKGRIESLQPSTLHRLLGWQKGSVGFMHHAGNPLPYDFVIVDESSMIDIPLFAKLLDASAGGVRVLLLGDKDQLASVDAGSLLGDLCDSVREGGFHVFEPSYAAWVNTFITDPGRRIRDVAGSTFHGMLSGRITELRLSHRFKALGGIGKFSRAVILGDEQAVQHLMDGPRMDSITILTGAEEDSIEKFAEGYVDYILSDDPADALQKLSRLRVLVAVREGPQGLHAVNKRIEGYLEAKKLLSPAPGFYVNRPVMVTRNNYELGLFNGDIGITRMKDGKLRVFFEAEEGQLRSVLASNLSHCETVFAMTIHKSQGSEFDDVLVMLPEGTDSRILSRELLYTAATRARKHLQLVSSRDTILHTIQIGVKRISGLAGRLQSDAL